MKLLVHATQRAVIAEASVSGKKTELPLSLTASVSLILLGYISTTPLCRELETIDQA